MASSLMRSETRVGEPIRVHGATIFPVARVLRILPRSFFGGLIWNRPVAIVVQREDRADRVIPIVDATRQVQISLLAGGIAGGLFSWWFARRMRRRR